MNEPDVEMLAAEKVFYDRFWALHRDPDLLRVFERFGIEPFRRSSVLEGFNDFLKEQQFGGKVCVEIGTWMGLTAIVLARYFEEVVTIDVVDQPAKHKIAEMLGVTNVRFVTVLDNEEKASFINSIQFDGAYVDGDHHRDTESDFALVRRCGRVLFHEFWAAQPAVVALVNRLGNVESKGKFALWTDS